MGENRTNQLWVAITLFQGKTGFYFACEKLYKTSAPELVEIGIQLCIRLNIQPSELMNSAPRYFNPKIIEEIQADIQRSLSSKQQKSARK